MPLTAGSRLGPYEILASIGAGGMGEVYRARDTKLGRDVALKILPAAFASDADRLARFKREAQVLASLNHPNVAAIYGLEESNGVQALVLELVEGPTLADRIAHGPIPVDEALPIARQIAEGLEAAHEQGIIHRDLKPANIKLRPDGSVKVLDFGLAKALEPPSAVYGAATMLPMITSPAMMTGVGVLLGTAAYMSPEQAKGREADTRSDIWAFGCVLYEMLTGNRAFAGDDVTDTIAAVVRAEPDWRALPSETPAAVRRILRRCLQKSQKERQPHIGAARLDIAEALAETAGTTPPLESAISEKGWRSSARLSWSVTIVLFVVLAGVLASSGAMYFRGSTPVDTHLYRSTISLTAYVSGDPAFHPALSPDGRRLAFVAPDANGRVMLWVRPLDSFEAQPLAGTEGAAAPFWSPESRFLAFVAGGKLKKINAAGGPAITLCDAEAPLPGAWNRDDVILFTPKNSSPLFRVAATGGTPSPVTTFDSETANLVHEFPSFLPDGRHFLFLSQSPNGSARGLEVGSLDSKDRKRLMEGGSNALYVPGHVLFQRDTTLMAQPFDTARLAFTGDAVPLAENIKALLSTGRRGVSFAASQTGVLVYQMSSPERSLVWLDRSGRRLAVLGDRTDYGDSRLSLSPDGLRAVVDVGADIWLVDARRGVRTRLVSDPSGDAFPIWSPDGTRTVFNSRRKGHLDLYQKSASGAMGSETVLLADSLDKFPSSWSPDGRFILYNARSSGTAADLWILPLTDERKAYPFLQTPFSETRGQFSPDGRWVAYVSDESGQSEIFVTPFPGPGGSQRISTTGGSDSRWRRDGKEIFYLAANDKLMAAAVTSGEGRFEVGRTQALFTVRAGYAWDVSPDGQRFLVGIPADENQTASMTLVVNWPALLGK